MRIDAGKIARTLAGTETFGFEKMFELLFMHVSHFSQSMEFQEMAECQEI